MIALSRAYVCKLGAPTLKAVDPAIFTLTYFQACMSCTFCHDQCCSHGVDIDLANAEKLKSVQGRFKDLVGIPSSEWFTGEVIKDVEFPSGQYVRTATKNGMCVFHGTKGCLIHSYCLEEGIDYHTLKPLVSTLFPLTFEHGLLTASTELQDGTLICSGPGPTCYDGAREELRYYFGDELVLELDGLANAR